MLGLFRSLHFFEPGQLDLQDVPIKEQDRVQRLILGRGGDIAANRQVAEEGCYFRCGHLTRVTLVVEEDEAPDPLQIRQLGSDAVVTQADDLAHLIQQPRLDEILVA
jgi:hypothetical protein